MLKCCWDWVSFGGWSVKIKNIKEACFNNGFGFNVASSFDVEKYFSELEKRAGVDCQAGIEIKRYTNYSSAVYESEVDGSEYELEANIIIDGIAFELDIEIVRNDLGYGIYSFEIDND